MMKRSLVNFTRTLISFRKEHPVFRRKKFFQGRKLFGASKDIVWQQPSGKEMTEQVWNESKIHSIGMILSGDALDEFTREGVRIADHTFLVLLNADKEPVNFHLPKVAEKWEIALHTFSKEPGEAEKVVQGGDQFKMEERSAVVMMRIS